MKEDEEKLNNQSKKVVIILISLIIFCFVTYYIQENNIDNKLDKCYRVSIAIPYNVTYTTSYTMHYNYNLYGKKNDWSIGVGAESLGWNVDKKMIMSRRYWLKVYCDDITVNRVIWDIPVPDTLKFVPANGWDKIPYGLDKK